MTYGQETTETIEKPIVPSVKLIDKIVNYRTEHGKPFFSLEFFPPRNETELSTFWPLLDQLKLGKPLFMDITWHSRTSLDPDDCLSSLGVASSTIKRFNSETVLHLTCSGYDEITLETILTTAKSSGIKNILALRGDLPYTRKEENLETIKTPIKGDTVDSVKQQSMTVETICPPNTTTITTINNDDDNDYVKCNQLVTSETDDGKQLTCALDLVKFIRRKFNDYFSLGVAGYPMGHPDGKSYSEDLNYLKAKVDAGADFIVTQLSFHADQYLTFIRDCRTIGITVPIIPGIFPIQTKVSIRNIAKLTQIEPPEDVKKAVDSCNGNVKAIQQYGLTHVVDLCRKLINSDLDIPGFHFYTLNRDNCITETLKQLNLWNQRSDQKETQIEPQTDSNLSISPTTTNSNIPLEPMVTI